MVIGGWIELAAALGAASAMAYSSRLERQGFVDLERRVRLLGAGLAFLLLLRLFVVEPYRGSGPSMLPTLPEESVVLVDKSAFGLRLPGFSAWLWRRRTPSPGEVVVARSPLGSRDEWLLKRVVAQAGDVVRVEGERIYVNGMPVEEAPEPSLLPKPLKVPSVWEARLWGHPHQVWLKESLERPSAAIVTWHVPEDHVFLAGDNRLDSLDSRTFGPVAIADVIGRVIGVWDGRGFRRPDAPTARSTPP